MATNTTFVCPGCHQEVAVGRNLVVEFPDPAESMTLCGNDCSGKKGIQTAAEKAWARADAQHRAQAPRQFVGHGHMQHRHTGETERSGGMVASEARRATKQLRDRQLRASMKGGAGSVKR